MKDIFHSRRKKAMSSFSLKKSVVAFVALVLLGSLTLTACNAAMSAGNPTPTLPKATATPDPKAGWPAKFVIGFFAGDNPEAIMLNNEPMRVYLEGRLGIKVELLTGSSYSAVIEALRAKKADAMQVGPFSYILAVQEAGAEALAVGITADAKNPVYNPKKLPYYYSVIITKKGSGVSTLADLKGKDFSFVDPASTSGHLMPRALLVKAGLNPDKDMRTIFAGSHPTSVSAVWNGKVHAGATYLGNVYNLYIDKQVELCFWPDGDIAKPRTEQEIREMYDACPEGKLVIIAMTDPIPNTPFAVRSDLPESFKAEVKAALLALKDNPEEIAKIKRWYVDPSKELGLKNLDAFYNPLREVAKVLDLNLKAME
jgi:phosphonate transport system substrate-binding protein